MKISSYLIIFLLFLILPEISAIPDTTVTFNSEATQYINISIDYSEINDFSFNLTGLTIDSSYPSNISIDIGDDSKEDWNYFSYLSEESADIKNILTAWSTNPNSAEIYIRSNMAKNSYGTGLAYIKNNQVHNYFNELSGSLSIANTAETINKQIISLTSQSKTIHVFLPYSSQHLFAGFYVAEGGSTYYCNTDHDFTSNDMCNLKLSEALIPEHLARQANQNFFNFTEPVTNHRITQTINQHLSECANFPCNITIKISSATPGEILFSDFKIISKEQPATIEITDDSSDNYKVTVSNTTPITEVKYFYGKMPKVYLIPFIGKDDTTSLTNNQKIRLNNLNTNIKSAWDDLTDNKHPLNFTFYLIPLKTNYLTSENNFLSYLTNSKSYILDNFDISTPSIIVIIDIHDYFPSQDPYNTRNKENQDGIISEIYLNGFSDTNSKTELYGYNDEILKNILLHELAHSFIFNPSKNKLFHSDHPASFTNLQDFSTYSAEESITSSEGYYEIYSILNQIRPYITNEEINNIKPTLSELEKMFLGTLNPYAEGEHTFYSGTITKINNKYQANSMTTIPGENASNLYSYSEDKQWWDITNTSTAEITFSNPLFIPKQNQDNQALWVYVNDIGHLENFKVSNLNANSIQKTIDEKTCINFLTNTSWSSWENISCLSNNKINQSRTLIQYDLNNCGIISNKSFYEYRQIISCDYSSSSSSSGGGNGKEGITIIPKTPKTTHKKLDLKEIISKIKKLPLKLIGGKSKTKKEMLFSLIVSSIITILLIFIIMLVIKYRKIQKNKGRKEKLQPKNLN